MDILAYVKRVQALAQSGLTYCDNPYDIERYEELREISFNMLNLLSEEPIEKIRDLFKGEKGYQTPKVDVRAVIMKDNKILLVREKIDNKWSLPGGWCDVGFSPSKMAKKEVSEEAGYEVEVEKLLALLDKENTGLILNAVHSRDNCFLYLKEIVKGESYVMLSQEEVEALRKAVNFGLGELEEDETDKLN